MGVAPHIYERFPGRPGSPRTPQIEDCWSVQKAYNENLGGSEASWENDKLNCVTEWEDGEEKVWVRTATTIAGCSGTRKEYGTSSKRQLEDKDTWPQGIS